MIQLSNTQVVDSADVTAVVAVLEACTVVLVTPGTATTPTKVEGFGPSVFVRFTVPPALVSDLTTELSGLTSTIIQLTTDDGWEVSLQ